MKLFDSFAHINTFFIPAKMLALLLWFSVCHKNLNTVSKNHHRKEIVNKRVRNTYMCSN